MPRSPSTPHPKEPREPPRIEGDTIIWYGRRRRKRDGSLGAPVEQRLPVSDYELDGGTVRRKRRPEPARPPTPVPSPRTWP
ncbi:MAG: hypothetical protein AB7R89_06190 [Dehalococcoidia bacterium]